MLDAARDFFGGCRDVWRALLDIFSYRDSDETAATPATPLRPAVQDGVNLDAWREQCARVARQQRLFHNAPAMYEYLKSASRSFRLQERIWRSEGGMEGNVRAEIWARDAREIEELLIYIDRGGKL